MPILTETKVYVDCDVCGDWWTATVTQNEARETLRKEGWTFGKLVKYPECQKTKSGEKHGV